MNKLAQYLVNALSKSNAHVKVNPAHQPGHPQDYASVRPTINTDTGDSDQSNSFQHHSDITNDCQFDFLDTP